MKPILFILGGSALQKDLLMTAKESYYCYVLDGNNECVLKDLADKFIHQDFSDEQAVYDYAVQYKPSLILTMANEFGNLVAARISERLGLNYNSVSVVYSTINKLVMKEKLLASYIPTPTLQAVFKEKIEKEKFNSISYPCVVKPAQSSAGRGVKLVYNQSQLEHSLQKAIDVSQDKCALIESFVEGEQFSVETISSQGQHAILAITKEYFGEKPYFAETQQVLPALLADDIKLAIEKQVLNVLNAFNIQTGACHIELRLNKNNDIVIIEIASRIGGWRSELLNLAYGTSYCQLLLNAHNNNFKKHQLIQMGHAIVKMLFTSQDKEKYDILKNDSRYQVSEIVWLKSKLAETSHSLIDSAGYYFILVSQVEDIDYAIV